MYLVLARILRPDSKRASCQMKDGFYGMYTDFTLPDVYRSLDHFADFEVELQRHLNERVKETIGRDLSYAFYDVTNYFFEIDFPNGEDDLKKKGASKKHCVDPIIAMGLFMDSNGLPVSMSIFPGNTSDSLTLYADHEGRQGIVRAGLSWSWSPTRGSIHRRISTSS